MNGHEDPGHAALAGSDGPACLNCGTLLRGPFCHACGQEAGVRAGSLGVFLSASLDDALSLGSRTLRSVLLLLFRPGTLTLEYVAGRRVRYTQPVQLYLIAAALFFVVNSFRPFIRFTEDNRVVSSLSSMTTGQSLSRAQVEKLQSGGVPAELFRERFRNAVRDALPHFMIGSIVLFALALAVSERRRPGMQHAIFALHWVAFFMLIMGAERLVPIRVRGVDAGAQAASVAALAHLVLSLRRIHGYRWWRAVRRGVGLWIAFNLILVAWVFSTVVFALHRAL